MDNVRLQAVVTGQVQGVGFRAFVQQQAYRSTLKGWVRNRWDGSVELVAEGPKGDLLSFLKAVQIGPRASSVDAVSVEWQPATGEFQGFQVRMTSSGD